MQMNRLCVCVFRDQMFHFQTLVFNILYIDRSEYVYSIHISRANLQAHGIN